MYAPHPVLTRYRHRVGRLFPENDGNRVWFIYEPAAILPVLCGYRKTGFLLLYLFVAAIGAGLAVM